MAKWTFEPMHTAAQFRVKHMMVSWVRGQIRDIKGKIEFDPEDLSKTSVKMEIPVKKLSTGIPEANAHLMAPDFFDAKNHPTITFKGSDVEVVGENEFKIIGELMIRGKTQRVAFAVQYLGKWATPWWVEGKNYGPMMRAGFLATTHLNRQNFGVSWNDTMEKGGVVVGNEVFITVDAEAILDSDLVKAPKS
jgi:polyisoprenoid-binding protein YceI